MMSKLQTTITYKTAWLMGIDPIATGQRLRNKRRDFELTQERLSEFFEMGGDPVSRNSIQNWESGRRIPSLAHVVFLAELYRCPIDELICSYRRSYDEGEQDQLIPFLMIIKTYKVLLTV